VDPATLSDPDRPAGRPMLLPTAQHEAIAALDNSTRLRRILGDPAVDLLVAVRRLEHERYGSLSPEELTEKFRMAWSV
ncbi:MAG: glutamine synthetase family protein, partial [Mycobacterium sp.]